MPSPAAPAPAPMPYPSQGQAQGGAPSFAAAPVAPGVGVGGAAAPLPAEFAYRRQGSNANGVLLIALKQDTFFNGGVVEGFIEFTATDDENVACITVELVEFHKKGPRPTLGHIWDRVLVRQGPWRARKGDVLPLPFALRVPPGTSITGRDVHWELRGQVDINWAVDIDCNVPIHMRNTDIERVRDSLGALDYRIVELDSAPLGQRFEGKFSPPANLRSQYGINDIDLIVEYLGANLKVKMHVDKKGIFKRDRDVEHVFDLAKFRTAPLAEVTAHMKAEIDEIMSLK
jgi:hypothetical protein